MIVVDLFSGLGGWSAPAIARGHRVFRVELEPRFPAELHADILDIVPAQLPFRPDLLLASPPCEGFSVMNIGRNWHHDGTPKTDTARLSLALVTKTLELIRAIEPTYWVMENPRAKLRVLPVVAGLDRRTVTYCQFGEERMKPTDLFSNRWPPSLTLAQPCRNGDPCHVRAPRGSRTGTQGAHGGDYWLKSVVPWALAERITHAAEVDLAAATGAAVEPLKSQPIAIGQVPIW